MNGRNNHVHKFHNLVSFQKKYSFSALLRMYREKLNNSNRKKREEMKIVLRKQFNDFQSVYYKVGKLASQRQLASEQADRQAGERAHTYKIYDKTPLTFIVLLEFKRFFHTTPFQGRGGGHSIASYRKFDYSLKLLHANFHVLYSFGVCVCVQCVSCIKFKCKNVCVYV